MSLKRHRCPNCPNNTSQPCQRAIERIRAIQLAQAKKENTANITIGCDWYLNMAEYQYSFHNLLADLDGSPMSDKDICKALLITQNELKEIYNSAIQKLSHPSNKETLQDLMDLVAERNNNDDNSVYMPVEFREQVEAAHAIITNDADNDDGHTPKKRGPKPKTKIPLHGMGLPLHHTGKRVDIHFGYSPARYKEIEENKKRIKKKDEDQKD